MKRRRCVPHALLGAAVCLLLASPAARAQAASPVVSEPDSSATSVPDLPRERYEAWVRESVDSWQMRDVEMVLGREWREAASGRDLLEALRQTDLPLGRWEPHPRFPGRICPRTRSSGQCATVSYMTQDERRRDLRDVPPSEIEAVIWVGPTLSSGPSAARMAWDAQYEVERIILFGRGYLAGER